MKHHPYGYTWIEVITATTIVLTVLVFVVATVNPARKYMQERDNARVAAMDDINQALLELQYTDAETFQSLLTHLENGRSPIGTAPTCLGNYGANCHEHAIQPNCVNLYDFGITELLPAIPIDPQNGYGSQEMTGFYLEATPETAPTHLTIGACAPESQETLTIKSKIRVK
jgi:hypothetical protein